MSTELSFTQDSQGRWTASFASSGERVAIEVNRTADGPLTVSASIGRLRPKPIMEFNRDADLLFEIDLPAGVTVALTSFTEVTAGQVTGL